MSSCVEFGGAKAYGYGRVSNPRSTQLAHRQAWIDEHGPIPDGMVVMHLCNNKACINVEHLKLGTNAENMAMAAADGLMHGVKNNRFAAKLTPRQVVAVRHMRRCGMQQRKIAQFFDVSDGCISMIVSGRTWAS